MAYNSDLGFKPNMDNVDIDNIRVKIRMLSDVAAQYANTSAVHALAGGYPVTMPSPAEFRKSLPALQAQDCPELAQAGRIIGTLGNPDGERVYHPFWDAIPFFVDGAGLHPKLFAVLALEQQTLEDAYKERFPSSFGEGIEVHISWKEFLKFAMKLGEVHPVHEKESKYLDVKRQRIELQQKFWNSGKLPDGGGPDLEKMWNAAYPERVTRAKTFQKTEVDDEVDELDEALGQQDGIAFPWQVPRAQPEQQTQPAGLSTHQQQPSVPLIQQQQQPAVALTQQQQPAGHSIQQQQLPAGPSIQQQQPAGSSIVKRGTRGPYKRTTKNLLLANTAPAQTTPGAAAAAPIIPVTQVPAKRARADSPQHQGPSPKTPDASLNACITDMDARHRRDLGDMQQQLAVLRNQLYQLNNECAARSNSMIGVAVQEYATRNTMLERRVLALEAANAAATDQNRQLRTRLAEVSTENMYLQGRLDDVTIGGGGRAH